jgi:hypothetical protein
MYSLPPSGRQIELHPAPFCRLDRPQALILKPAPDGSHFLVANVIGAVLFSGTCVTLRHLNRQRAAQAAGCCGDNRRRRALVGRTAGAGARGRKVLPHYAACRIVFRSARHRTHPSRHELALRVYNWSCGGRTHRRRSGQDLSGTELGIERWLVPRPTVFRPEAGSFRMATTLALSLALAGSSLALGRFERHRLAASAQRPRWCH